MSLEETKTDPAFKAVTDAASQIERLRSNLTVTRKNFRDLARKTDEFQIEMTS